MDFNRRNVLSAVAVALAAPLGATAYYVYNNRNVTLTKEPPRIATELTLQVRDSVVAPRAGSLSTRMSPPWRRTME